MKRVTTKQVRDEKKKEANILRFGEFPVFPFEVFGLIFSCLLHFGEEFLFRMSSVCRAWNENIPAYLYHLILYEDPSYERKQYFKENLEKFINLQSLDLSFRPASGFFIQDKIIDEKIKLLSNLKTLDLSFSHAISNETLKLLTNLTDLNLTKNFFNTSEGVKNLTNLIHLNLSENNSIFEDALILLTKLETLNLSSLTGTNFTTKDVSHLSNLKLLDISHGKYYESLIKTKKLSHLTNLKIIENDLEEDMDEFDDDDDNGYDYEDPEYAEYYPQ